MYVKEITRDGVYTVYGDAVGVWMESRACGGHEDHTSSSYSAICLQQVYDKSTAGRRNGVRGLGHYRSVGRSVGDDVVGLSAASERTDSRSASSRASETNDDAISRGPARTLRGIFQQCLITQPLPPRAFLN